MKGFLTLVLSGLLTITACAFGSRAGEAKSNRDVTEFTGLDVGTGIRTNVVMGDSCTATVSAPADVIDYIVTEVKNGTLFVYWKKKTDIKWLDRVEVNVTAVSLNRIKTSSGGIVTTDTINADILTLAASSGSQLDVLTRANTVVAKASSGATIKVIGNAQKANLDVSSGARIKGDQLKTAEAEVKASSGAGVTTNVSGRLDAEASSGGRIRYAGTPTNAMVTAHSGGSVTRL